jgi:hypothetical protein
MEIHAGELRCCIWIWLAESAVDPRREAGIRRAARDAYGERPPPEPCTEPATRRHSFRLSRLALALEDGHWAHPEISRCD